MTTGSSIKLVIAGRKIWWSNEIEEMFDKLRFKNDVIFTGRIPDDELKNILGAASALTYVSLFEGFGIPVLEAMRCDVPVITSNVSSLPEVAGDAALLVDPDSIDSIAEAMNKISTDGVMRNNIIEKSKLQREKFSWQRTADLMWASVVKSIEG